jgi:hypothetical protein
MNHLDASEIVFGLVLDEKLKPEFVSASLLADPYDQAIKIMTEGGDITEVMDKVGLSPIQAAQDAARMADGKIDWIKALEIASNREYLASILERDSKKLRRGEDIDKASLLATLDDIDGYGNRYTTLDKVDPDNAKWQLTGYKPIDEHMGGIPQAGLTIIAARPGVGKTSLLIELALAGLQLNPDARVLFYSFEMTLRQLTNRLLEIKKVSMKTRSRIIATEEIITVKEVYADASRIASKEKILFIGLDFADLMIDTAVDESTTAMIYRTVANLAKKTKVPVILLAQFNRDVEGIPRVTNIRWSGLAEAVAASILLLHNPDQIFARTTADDRLPAIFGRGYIIHGKSRFGYQHGGVGAVQVAWNGAEAWGDESFEWCPL